jgi:hypothetical protein
LRCSLNLVSSLSDVSNVVNTLNSSSTQNSLHVVHAAFGAYLIFTRFKRVKESIYNNIRKKFELLVFILIKCKYSLKVRLIWNWPTSVSSRTVVALWFYILVSDHNATKKLQFKSYFRRRLSAHFRGCICTLSIKLMLKQNIFCHFNLDSHILLPSVYSN